jgi:hypothetical protein
MSNVSVTPSETQKVMSLSMVPSLARYTGVGVGERVGATVGARVGVAGVSTKEHAANKIVTTTNKTEIVLRI